MCSFEILIKIEHTNDGSMQATKVTSIISIKQKTEFEENFDHVNGSVTKRDLLQANT